MDCNQVKDSLYDLAANQLDEKERVSVEEHLKECQNCRKDLLLLQDTLPILDSWEAPRLSAKTIDRMTENILNKQIPWWQRMMDRITLPPRFDAPRASFGRSLPNHCRNSLIHSQGRGGDLKRRIKNRCAACGRKQSYTSHCKECPRRSI